MEKIQISLAAARVNANLSQKNAAKMLGITRQTLMNWENGKVKPKIMQINALAELYGIPVEYIFLPL